MTLDAILKDIHDYLAYQKEEGMHITDVPQDIVTALGRARPISPMRATRSAADHATASSRAST